LLGNTLGEREVGLGELRRRLLAALLLLLHLPHRLGELREPLLGLRQRLVKAARIKPEACHHIADGDLCHN
jgi:hypothetical protein